MVNTSYTNNSIKSKKGLMVLSLVLASLFFVLIIGGVVFPNSQGTVKTTSNFANNSGSNVIIGTSVTGGGTSNNVTALAANNNSSTGSDAGTSVTVVNDNSIGAGTAVSGTGSSVNVPLGYEYGTGSVTKTFYWEVNGAQGAEVLLMPGDWINMYLTYANGPLAGTVVPCSNVTICGSYSEPAATYTWTGLYDPTTSNSQTNGETYTVHYTYYIQLQNGTEALVSGTDTTSIGLSQCSPTASINDYVCTSDPST